MARSRACWGADKWPRGTAGRSPHCPSVASLTLLYHTVRPEPFDSGHPERFDSVRPEPVEGRTSLSTGPSKDDLRSGQVGAQTRVPGVLAPFLAGYAASPDGQRCLLNSVRPETDPATITVILNWRAAPKGRADWPKRTALSGICVLSPRDGRCCFATHLCRYEIMFVHCAFCILHSAVRIRVAFFSDLL